jgi:hypothetical protein
MNNDNQIFTNILNTNKDDSNIYNGLSLPHIIPLPIATVKISIMKKHYVSTEIGQDSVLTFIIRFTSNTIETLIINYKIFQKTEKLKKNYEKLRYQQYNERKKNEKNENEKNENENNVMLTLIIHLQCCLLSFLLIRFQIEIFIISNRRTYGACTYIPDFQQQQDKLRNLLVEQLRTQSKAILQQFDELHEDTGGKTIDDVGMYIDYCYLYYHYYYHYYYYYQYYCYYCLNY